MMLAWPRGSNHMIGLLGVDQSHYRLPSYNGHSLPSPNCKLDCIMFHPQTAFKFNLKRKFTEAHLF